MGCLRELVDSELFWAISLEGTLNTTLWHDAATDRTQEQKPARGRFRRTLKMFTKFIRNRRRNIITTAPEGTAKLNSRQTKFPAEPDVHTNLTAPSENFDTALNDLQEKAVVMEMTEGISITNSDSRMTQGLENTDTMPTPTMIHAPSMDFFKESAVSPQQQVPAIVKNIHQRLASHITMDARMQIDIVRLAEEHPADVVLTLLRCAPTCDRAAAMMWRAIGSSVPTLEKVLPTLLCVMEDWPLYCMFTSDGDDKHVFALAATLVVWVIVQVPECHEAIILYSSRLFVALLFHVVITTQQMPQEVHHFWRACQQEHHLPRNPKRSPSLCPSHVLVASASASASAPSVTWLCSAHRFAVQAIKSLLCRLQCDNEVIAMECKRGWDMMLCAHTQHYAMGLLAREMRRVLIPLCSRVAIHLIRMLSIEKPGWDLPFLAFLVEVLECLDLIKCGGSVLRVMSKYLHSKCRQRRRMALRGLMVLSQDPLMARRMCSLSQSFVELLDDADGEMVAITLGVFTNMFKNKDIVVSSITAPKLAEALLELFDNDNSYVQLLSIDLFCKVIELVVDEGKKHLKIIVNESLYPLLIYCHDVNQLVANASRETLHCLAKFLKRKDLEQLLKKEHPLNMDECKLADDRSRAAEHLRRALPYLESPQESLREAALRFIGEPRAGAAAALWQPCPGAAARAAGALTGSVFSEVAGVPMMGQKEELQLISMALQAQRQDSSPSCSNLQNQAPFPQKAEELGTSSESSEPVSQEHTRDTEEDATSQCRWSSVIAEA
ncbi:maestro heat-like repeat family member 5 [Sylvia atricapilla]|uniref:maestro heat-like repeat family member 5 n=1 Tax=Sylvia atricapilla TaxID=48155 RepID=UPI0033936B77